MNLATRPVMAHLSALIALLLGPVTLTHTSSALADPIGRPADAQSLGLHALSPSTPPGAMGLAPPQRNEQFLQSSVAGVFLSCRW